MSGLGYDQALSSGALSRRGPHGVTSGNVGDDGRPDSAADAALKTLAEGASARGIDLPVSHRHDGAVIDVDTAVLDDLSFSATQEELEKTWSGVLQGFDDTSGAGSGVVAPSGRAGENADGGDGVGVDVQDRRGETPIAGRDAADGAEVQDYLTQTVSIQHTQFTQVNGDVGAVLIRARACPYI